MPTYDYKCTSCHHTLEAFQKISDPLLTTCPNCGEESLQRGPGGGVGLIFKGTGFYKTDYANPSSSAPESSSPSSCCPCGKNKKSCSSSES